MTIQEDDQAAAASATAAVPHHQYDPLIPQNAYLPNPAAAAPRNAYSTQPIIRYAGTPDAVFTPTSYLVPRQTTPPAAAALQMQTLQVYRRFNYPYS